MTNCGDNLGGVLELALQFDIGSDLLWDSIITKAQEDNTQIA